MDCKNIDIHFETKCWEAKKYKWKSVFIKGTNQKVILLREIKIS